MAALQYPEGLDSPTRSDQLTETEQALHRLFDLVYSEGDLSVADEVVSATVQGYCAGTDKTIQGISGLKSHATRLRATFAGLTVEVDEVHRTPDGFVASLVATGRFERAFAGVQPPCIVGGSGEDPGGLEVTVACRVNGTMTGGQMAELAFDWEFEAFDPTAKHQENTNDR